MSWDVHILKFDGEASFKKIELPGFKPLPMGTAQEMRGLITENWPETDWSDSGWGWLYSNGLSIEFSLDEGIIDSLMLHVRGSGNPIPSIVRLCHRNGWVAFDGDQILTEASAEGWQEWQAFRDQVVEHIQRNPGDEI